MWVIGRGKEYRARGYRDTPILDMRRKCRQTLDLAQHAAATDRQHQPRQSRS